MKQVAALLGILALLAGIALIARALTGCIGWKEIPVRDAYWIERGQCDARLDGGTEDDVRGCQSMVDRKYSRYWQEGKRYPDPNESAVPVR